MRYAVSNTLSSNRDLGMDAAGDDSVQMLAASLSRFTAIDDRFISDVLVPLRTKMLGVQALSGETRTADSRPEPTSPPDLEVPVRETIMPLDLEVPVWETIMPLDLEVPVRETIMPLNLEVPVRETIMPLDTGTESTNPSAVSSALWARPLPATAVSTDFNMGLSASVASHVADQDLMGPLGLHNQDMGLYGRAGAELMADAAVAPFDTLVLSDTMP